MDQIKFCFYKRIHAVSIRVCRVATVLFAIAAVGSFYYGLKIVFLADLIGIVGSALALVLLLKKQDCFDRPNSSWIAYLCYWLSLYPLIVLTGGIQSPFCGENLSVLFLAGTIFQTRFPWWQLGLFILVCMALMPIYPVEWIGPYAIAMPPPLIFLRHFLTLTSFIVVAATLIKVHKASDEEAYHQKEILSETQSHLTHTIRLAEAGDLLATTAHELAQPVQVISICTSLYEGMVQDPSTASPDKQKKLIEKMKEASNRLNRLLTQIKNFARKEPLQHELLDLRDVIHSIQLLTEHDLKVRNIFSRFEFPPEAVWINGDLCQIQQVLLNLINNARDASISAEEPRVTLFLNRHLHYGRICVQNNGGEIPLNIQPKLFEPYFTTKTRGMGTGLGLSISAKIIENHRGRMFFSSGIDQTSFWVDIPMAAPVESSLLTGLRQESFENYSHPLTLDQSVLVQE